MPPASFFASRTGGVIPWILVAGWFIFAALGFPPPSVDDISYAGPAIEVAHGHGPINPWAPYYEKFGGHATYPPFFTYLLAGWLKVFGVTTASFLFFSALCGAAVTLSLAFWIRRWQLPPWTNVVASFLVLALAFTRGLRPDLCGFALLAVGTCLESGGGEGRRTLGAAVLGASVGTLPLLIWPVGTLFLYRLAEAWLRGGASALRRPALRWGVAAVAVGFLLLLGIGFHLVTFLRDLRENSGDAVVIFGPLYSAYFFHSPRLIIELVVLPALFVGGAVAVGSTAWRGAPSGMKGLLAFRLGAVALLFATMFAGITASSTGLPALDLVCAIGVAGFAGWLHGRGWRFASAGLVLSLCVLFLACYWEIVNWAISRPPDPKAAAAIREEVERERPDRIMVDVAALRYVYDYRLPDNARDFYFDEWTYPRWIAVPPGERKESRVWIISAKWLSYVDGFRGDSRLKVLRVFGREVPHWLQNESDVFLLR